MLVRSVFPLFAAACAGPPRAPAGPPGAARAEILQRPPLAAVRIAAGGLEREIACDAATGAWATRALRFGGASPTWVSPERPSPEYEIVYDVPGERQGIRLRGDAAHRVVDMASRTTEDGAAELTASLDCADHPLRVTFTYQAFSGHPVVRQRLVVENRGGKPVQLRRVSLVRLRVDFPEGGFDGFSGLERVDKKERPLWFRPHMKRLSPGHTDSVLSGRHKAASWAALAAAAPGAPGLFAGWETNVDARGVFGDSAGDGACHVDVMIQPDAILDPGERFEAPWAFLGAFTGDLDEAAYRTHRFVEERLARRIDDPRFPYVMFNTWGFGERVGDALARKGIGLCAKLGVEVFNIDFGWEDPDWIPLKDKFPDGLAPLSDLAHANGMKFGLHFAFGNISTLSKAYQEHPEWAFGPGGWCYKDAGKPMGLSLGHPDARAWAVRKFEEVVRREKLDWVITDSVLWGACDERVQKLRASNHYTTVALGYEQVMDEINRRLPGLLLEHVDGGGSLFNYHMVRNHVTACVCDNDQVLPTRVSVYFNSYPLPPRYQDSYMQEWGTAYCHRSHMFGGPWILMNRLNEAPPGSPKWERLAKDIAKYKELRALIRDGKVLHLLAPHTLDPARPWDGWDAIGSYHPGQDRAVIFVFRTRGDVPERAVPLKALRPEGRYRVRFEDTPGGIEATGAALMRDGVRLSLEAYEPAGGRDVHASEIVYIDPAR